MLPTLLRCGPMTTVTDASARVTLCASVSPCAPPSQCLLCAPVSSCTTMSPQRLSVPTGTRSCFPRTGAVRGVRSPRTPRGGECGSLPARPGGRGGRGGGRREAKEGGGSAPPPRPVQGKRRAGSGRGRLGPPRREAGKAAAGADGRTDGRSAAPGAQRLARAALSPAGELRAEGGGGRCSEPGFVLTEPVSCERGAETGTGQGTAGAGLGYEVGAQGYEVGEVVVQSRGAAV